MNTLHIDIVTGERQVLSDEATMVIARGADGILGLLPHHARILALLVPGELRVKKDTHEDLYFVSGGFLEMSNNRVIVLADTAEQAEDIDLQAAEEAMRRAEEAMLNRAANVDQAETEANLRRAMIRLRVAEQRKRKGHVSQPDRH